MLSRRMQAGRRRRLLWGGVGIGQVKTLPRLRLLWRPKGYVEGAAPSASSGEENWPFTGPEMDFMPDLRAALSRKTLDLRCAPRKKPEETPERRRQLPAAPAPNLGPGVAALRRGAATIDLSSRSREPPVGRPRTVRRVEVVGGDFRDSDWHRIGRTPFRRRPPRRRVERLQATWPRPQGRRRPTPPHPRPRRVGPGRREGASRQLRFCQIQKLSSCSNPGKSSRTARSTPPWRSARCRPAD
jgi:hypothetical protein